MWQGEWLQTLSVCSPTIRINSLPSLLAVFLVLMINYMVTLVLRCIFSLLRPGAPFVSWDTWPLWGMLVANVNKGCTVTTQSRHRVEASCQLHVGVQRLMGWKKALRKGGNFRNPKTVNSWRHVEGCSVLGKTALDSMQMASQVALHWGIQTYSGWWGLWNDWWGWGTRVRYPTNPGVVKEGECGLKKASQSSWVKSPRMCCGHCSI